MRKNTTFLTSKDHDRFSNKVQISQFRKDGEIIPFLESDTTSAIFDPQVDYLYVSQLEFTEMIVPKLKKIYKLFDDGF